MKENNKSQNKACAILHSISATLFTLSGIMRLAQDGFKDWMGITNIALGITFGSLAFIYFKRYREENKK